MEKVDYRIDINDPKKLKQFVECELALHNPIVNTCLRFHRQGTLTYEEALLRAIVHLAEKSDDQQKQLFKEISARTHPITI